MTLTLTDPQVSDEIPAFLIIPQEARAQAWANWPGFAGGIPVYHDPVAERQKELLAMQAEHAARDALAKVPERIAYLEKRISDTDPRDHAAIKKLQGYLALEKRKLER